MPKKTLKQKLLADQHQKNFLTYEQPTYKFIAPISANSPPASRELSTSANLVYNDLRKTLVISFIFIAGEILLAILSKKFGW